MTARFIAYKSFDRFSKRYPVTQGCAPDVRRRNIDCTVKEFIAYARQHPGTINYATSGVGSTTHLSGAYFAARTGIELVAVPYKGSEVVADLISGRVGAMFLGGAPWVLQAVKDGKLNALAVTSRTPMRTPLELPTVESAGELPGYEYATWFGFIAPAKVPTRILDQLSRDIRASVQDAEVRDRLAKQAIFPRVLGPAYFVSDGYLTLAILPFIIEGSTPTCGLNHFGFAVEDCEEIAARLAAFGIGKPKKRPADRPYAEVRAADPDGNMFDLSQRGFEETAAARAGKLPA